MKLVTSLVGLALAEAAATRDERHRFNAPPLNTDVTPRFLFGGSRPIPACDSTLPRVLAKSLHLSPAVMDTIFDMLRDMQEQISNEKKSFLPANSAVSQPAGGTIEPPPPPFQIEADDGDSEIFLSDERAAAPVDVAEIPNGDEPASGVLPADGVDDVSAAARAPPRRLYEPAEVITQEDIIAIKAGLPDLNVLLTVAPEILIGFLSSKVTGRFLEMAMGPTVVLPQYAVHGLVSGNLDVKASKNNYGVSFASALEYARLSDFDFGLFSCGLMDAAFYGVSCLVPGNAFQCFADPATSLPFMSDKKCKREDGSTLDTRDSLSSADMRFSDAHVVKIRANVGARFRSDIPYLNFRAIQAASRRVSDEVCQLVTSNQKYPRLVPGHRVEQVFRLREAGEPAGFSSRLQAYSFAWLSRRFAITTDEFEKQVKSQETCDFHLTIRDVLTEAEKSLQFSMRQIPMPFTRANSKTECSGLECKGEYVLVHEGAWAVAQSILPMLKTRFEELVEKNECNIYLHITGHGFGGAVGEIVALSLGNHFRDVKGVRIDASIFGPMRSMSQFGYDQLLATNVNVETWISEFDHFAFLPIKSSGSEENGIPRCDSKINLLNHGKGRDRGYGEHVNVIPITSQQLGKAHRNFNNFNMIDLWTTLMEVPKAIEANLPTPMRLEANHLCAYACTVDGEADGSGLNGKTGWMCNETQCPSLAGGHYYHDLVPPAKR